MEILGRTNRENGRKFLEFKKGLSHLIGRAHWVRGVRGPELVRVEVVTIKRT